MPMITAVTVDPFDLCTQRFDLSAHPMYLSVFFYVGIFCLILTNYLRSFCGNLRLRRSIAH